jgi:tetratricopeptide (TPR) repeat protein
VSNLFFTNPVCPNLPIRSFGRRISVGFCLLLFVILACPLAAQPPGTAPPVAASPNAAASGDIELVERLLAARREYQTALERLRSYYSSIGDVEHTRWAEEELIQFHRVPKQAYRLELDVPPPTLQALYNIPEANELYRKALLYKDKGWGTDYTDNQRRAEILFQQLLTSYPQSDKISDTAYQLGDVYESKAYRQFRRAAQYFERCVQWHPNTQCDARLRAARLYEKQLNERGKAIELYRDVTSHETDPKRLQEAQRKLTELSGQK